MSIEYIGPRPPDLSSISYDPMLLAWVALLCITIVITRRALKPKASIPWRINDKLIIDLRGGNDTLHTIVDGMSGTGKSSVLQDLLMLPMPAVVVAFDNSRPIMELFEAMGWRIWRPTGTMGWDIVNGPSQVVSEALTSGFDKTEGDTGFNSGIASIRIWNALDKMDADGIPRDMNLIIAALRKRSGVSTEDQACISWAIRLELLAKSLGPALGNDFNLTDAVAAGEKVLILPNYFISPRVAPLVGGIALVQTRRTAAEVGNFIIVVEEAGQSKRRRVELVPIWQAGRDRGCPSVAITQNASKLPDEVRQNSKVHLVFAQEEDDEIRLAVSRMRKVPAPEDFHEENLTTGWCWVRAPGISPRRVRVQLPTLPRRDLVVTDPTPYGQPAYRRRRTIVREIKEPGPVVLGLPMPELKVRELLSRIDRSQGDCWLWTGSLSRDGYGLVRWTYADGRPANNRPAHQVVWEVINGRGFPSDERGRVMDWDHRASCPRHCVNPHHGEPTTRAENVKRMHRVRGHLVAD